MLDPEVVEAALFNLLTTAVGALPFKTVSRHARIWSNLTPGDQPAFFLLPMGGHTEQNQAFGIPKYVLRYLVLVYTRADGIVFAPTDPPPQTLLNNAWKAIIGVLLTTPRGDKQTLGGLVENAWIDGESTMQPGVLDSQCALEIPVHAITGL